MWIIYQGDMGPVMFPYNGQGQGFSSALGTVQQGTPGNDGAWAGVIYDGAAIWAVAESRAVQAGMSMADASAWALELMFDLALYLETHEEYGVGFDCRLLTPELVREWHDQEWQWWDRDLPFLVKHRGHAIDHQGGVGDPGAGQTITNATAHALPFGQPPTVQLNGDTLAFGIPGGPPGQDGERGPVGEQGQRGPKGNQGPRGSTINSVGVNSGPDIPNGGNFDSSDGLLTINVNTSSSADDDKE